MKIPNYDSNFSATTGYKQGHPSMPADVFRMLICGPSNSGKTNILLHMIYKLLEFDKVYLFSKKLHQNKYEALLRDFASNIDPDVLATRSWKRLEMKSYHSKNSRLTTKKLSSLMIWFVKATRIV